MRAAAAAVTFGLWSDSSDRRMLAPPPPIRLVVPADEQPARSISPSVCERRLSLISAQNVAHGRTIPFGDGGRSSAGRAAPSSVVANPPLDWPPDKRRPPDKCDCAGRASRCISRAKWMNGRAHENLWKKLASKFAAAEANEAERKRMIRPINHCCPTGCGSGSSCTRRYYSLFSDIMVSGGRMNAKRAAPPEQVDSEERWKQFASRSSSAACSAAEAFAGIFVRRRTRPPLGRLKPAVAGLILSRLSRIWPASEPTEERNVFGSKSNQNFIAGRRSPTSRSRPIGRS